LKEKPMSDKYPDSDGAPSEETPEVEAHVVDDSVTDSEVPSWCGCHHEN